MAVPLANCFCICVALFIREIIHKASIKLSSGGAATAILLRIVDSKKNYS